MDEFLHCSRIYEEDFMEQGLIEKFTVKEYLCAFYKHLFLIV